MEALVLKDYLKFNYEETPTPEPGAGEVLVAVKACGICGSDVHGMDGSTGRRRPPVIMGHEAAGVIAEVGSAAFAQKYGVKAYATLDELIAAGAAEMITVTTPHPAHADAATKAARAGLHVLVEKPLASSLADCDAILAAARAGGGNLGMICQRRFFEPCQRIRRAIDEGKLGRPILGTVTMLGWRDAACYRSDPWRGSWQGEGGGVLVNQAPHQLDLLLWYMGEIDEMFGYQANLNHPTLV
jgi:predicted dehydrogenase